MHDVYLKTHFKTQPGDDWTGRPNVFAIITAWPTTGETWPQERIDAADKDLEMELRAQSAWVRRLTGYDPDSNHAEPGWAAAIDFDTACDVGARFEQVAIYFVEDDTLYVAECDARRREIVASFAERLALPGH
jgi:hypothetical protein